MQYIADPNFSISPQGKPLPTKPGRMSEFSFSFPFGCEPEPGQFVPAVGASFQISIYGYPEIPFLDLAARAKSIKDMALGVPSVLDWSNTITIGFP